ncbi:MAG: hypothetical protein NUV86_06025 [Candidatus Scalindua sp.]|nr:hypothetical protein [Candidatus Scalindua sp.]MCR4344408.1 hypothetical protein [Candidatus Scalindua sp.]
MVIINKEKAKEMYYANMMCEYHKATEKIRLFTKKYEMSFDQFEKDIKGSEQENFERWDDYMEWKGYENVLQTLIKEKKELEVGDYKVS